MPIDLSFRALSFPQAREILAAAERAGVPEGSAGLQGLSAMASIPLGAPRAEAAPLPNAAIHAMPSNPIPPKPVEREPGSDDGPPLSEAEAAFFRCPTVRAVVKMLVGEDAAPVYDVVLARCVELRAHGVAALEAVPLEQLGDRVAASFAALGF